MDDNLQGNFDSKVRRSQRQTSSFVGNTRQSITIRFGIALRTKRKQMGMTQAELAQATGIARTYISEVECGRESISLERAEKLAQAVGGKLSELIAEE